MTPPDWALVTGFGPFAGVEANPTQRLAEQLDGLNLGAVRVSGHVLDVSFARAPLQLRGLVESGWPRFLVHFGVATTADHIRIETQAVNLAAPEVQDVDDRQPENTPVHGAFPLGQHLPTKVPAQDLVDHLNAAGLPARLSDDAGRYVCNALYFHSLAALHKAEAQAPCIFVHLPPVESDPTPESEADTAWTEERHLAAGTQILRWLLSLKSP